MDSKLKDVSLSATGATHSSPGVYLKVSLSRSSDYSLPIRAPPTVDSDIECPESTNSQKHNVRGSISDVSDSRFESEGFVSGQDEFESAVERPFVADSDDETLEDTNYIEKYVIARPYLTDQDEEDAMEGSDDVEEYFVSRPLVVDVGDETLGASMEEEDKRAPPLVEPSIVDIRMLSPQELVRPFAQLSADSDEDAAGSGEVDEGGYSGTIRVPRSGAFEKIDNAPKVKVWAVEDGEEEESEFYPAWELEVVVDTISGEYVNGVWCSSQERNVAKDSDKEDSISAELIEDTGPDDKEEEKFESLVASQDDNLLGNSKLGDDVKRWMEGGDVLEVEGERYSEFRKVEILESNWDLDMMSELANRVSQKVTASKLFGVETPAIQIVEQSFPSESFELNMQGMKIGNIQMEKGINCAVEVPMDDCNNKNNGVDVGQSITFCQGIDNWKLEGKIEQKTDLGVKSNDFVTSRGIGSIDIDIMGNEIQNLDHTKFSEAHQTREIKSFRNYHTPGTTLVNSVEDGLHCKFNTLEPVSLGSCLDSKVEVQAEVEECHNPNKSEERERISRSLDDAEASVFGESDMAKQTMNEVEKSLEPTFLWSGESAQNHSWNVDGQTMAEPDPVSEVKELFDSASQATILKTRAGAGLDGDSVKFTSSDDSMVFPPENPANLSASLHSFGPIPHLNRPNLSTFPELWARVKSEENPSDDEKKMLVRIQAIRVKFFRLVQRLGCSLEDSIAAQVLHRLVLDAGSPSCQEFSLESAKKTATELEAEVKNDLNFSLNILVIGKTGVGKSSTINSIFGEEKATIDAFEPATNVVREIVGKMDGVEVKVLDTPGLRSSLMEKSFNLKVLSSIKKFTKKCPPDIVLYVDRVDTQTSDPNDMPLLRLITSSLGSSIWHNTIITLTHAASTPPNGPFGTPLSYEVFVTQQSRLVQQLISKAAGDLLMTSPRMMNPVSLVENDGQKVLPNGKNWRSQLLLLCYSMKILSEAYPLVKTPYPLDYWKPSGFQVCSFPLPYLLFSQLQPHVHPKLDADQGGRNSDSNIMLGELYNYDQEGVDEYDQLPSFKPLRRSQIRMLSKEQKLAFFEDYDYRVKTLQKKQWRQELKRLREMRKKGKTGGKAHDCVGEDGNRENGSPAAVAIPLSEMAFFVDNPAYRYPFLKPTACLLTRPVMVTHGWDHDCEYDGVSLEKCLAIAGRFPAVIAVQLTKDKKEFNIQLDSSVAANHGENGSTMAGLDIQTIGKQLAYVLKSETKFKNFKVNKTAAGVSVTFLGENLAAGLKIEDQIAFGKHLVLLGSMGAIWSQGNVAYGTNLEVILREKETAIREDQTTLGLSLMRWRGDLIWGCNLQSHFSFGRSSKMAVHAGVNNKLSGQISVRTSSSEQIQFTLLGILPIATAIFRNFLLWFSDKYAPY